MGAVDTGVSGNPLEQCEVGLRLGLGYAGLRQGLSSKIPCAPGTSGSNVFGTVESRWGWGFRSSPTLGIGLGSDGRVRVRAGLVWEDRG